MKSEEILIELYRLRLRHNITMKDIGKKLNVTKQAVSNEARRKSSFPSLKVKLGIAEALKKDPLIVWPELLPLKKSGGLKNIPHFGIHNS